MPRPFVGKHRARTHSECRAALCALCFTRGAGKLQSITREIERQVQTLLQADFSLSKLSLPTSICTSCRLKLSRFEKVLDLVYSLHKFIKYS